MTSLARRYARALFEVAEERKATEAVAADLAHFDAVLADADLRAAVLRPELPASLVGRLVAKLGEGRHELVRNLLLALAGRRRLGLLVELRAAFDALALASRGEVEGVVESARPLAAAEVDALAAEASRLSGRKVHLRVREVPELIGGVRLRVGNTLWDGSVASQLEGLRQRLRDVPIASA